MNHLLRSHAPITDDGWQQLEHEIQQRVVPALAARGWSTSRAPTDGPIRPANLGRVAAIAAPREGLQRLPAPGAARWPSCAPTSRCPGTSCATSTGARPDPDLAELDSAARRIAEAENVAVFHGWPAAGVVGIAEGDGLTRIALGEDVELYPRHVAKAVETLLSIGISGPYGLALGPDGYTSLVETTEHGGLIVFDHLRQILGGPDRLGPRGATGGGPEPPGRRLLLRGRPGPVARLRPPRRRPRAPLPRGELYLPEGHARSGGRPHPVVEGCHIFGRCFVIPRDSN